MNRAIQTALCTIALAQFLKIPFAKRKTKKWDWNIFFETGGMPSSHSAGVASLATYVALKRGVHSIDFALSAVFGLIVMYDAQGVRYQAGELAIRVNELTEEIKRLNGDQNDGTIDRRKELLRERLGHQPIEVVGGALLGIVTGGLSYVIGRRRRSL
ncbi:MULTISPECIES: divergent PAP2 family protein [Anoxybacillus]|uniref:Acid phosphatase/vanadium-dependent haloperoxidase n=1 Tax=Anoxybacillus flavithermus AK1 TaxID=1297581 RepID=M8CTU2_9BACL|nr:MULTISPECIES: divergent PAP2 family protein [Anoxybacillus]EMT44958.1 hypothetical protein H919_12628 [Anoxybacillus flavithermus AK1]MBW7651832.1 divergent PAP2 family protein [Anoxybacillus sp. ST4]